MAPSIAKNEANGAKRRCDLIVMKDGAAARADHYLDFVGLGMLFVSSNASPHYAAGGGTCTNKRVPLTGIAIAATASSPGADTITKAGHSLQLGDGPIRPNSNTGGLLTTQDYWAIPVDPNTFQLALTLQDAYDGTPVDITADVTGVTFTGTASCSRGLDGFFVYEFTVGEVNVDVNEISVIVDGAGYSLANFGGCYTTVELRPASSDVLEAQLESDGTTVIQGLRAMYRGETQLFDEDIDGNIMHKKPDGTDSHGGKIVEGVGRVSKNIVDLDE